MGRTFVNPDGSVSICTTREGRIVVFEYSKDMKLLKTRTFENEREKLGAFTKDSEGNYYFFFAEDAISEESKDQENMVLVKYDPAWRLKTR